jgi:hypothetical protein
MAMVRVLVPLGLAESALDQQLPPEISNAITCKIEASLSNLPEKSALRRLPGHHVQDAQRDHWEQRGREQNVVAVKSMA